MAIKEITKNELLVKSIATPVAAGMGCLWGLASGISIVASGVFFGLGGLAVLALSGVAAGICYAKKIDKDYITSTFFRAADAIAVTAFTATGIALGLLNILGGIIMTGVAIGFVGYAIYKIHDAHKQYKLETPRA